MSDIEDNGPDTPKACEACGGEAETECAWCTDGFQNVEQQAKWRRMRRRMQSVSGTYSGFQGIMESMIDRLEDHDAAGSKELRAEGRELVDRWNASLPGTWDRDEATRVLMVFHQKAVDLLQGK